MGSITQRERSVLVLVFGICLLLLAGINVFPAKVTPILQSAGALLIVVVLIRTLVETWRAVQKRCYPVAFLRGALTLLLGLGLLGELGR